MEFGSVKTIKSFAESKYKEKGSVFIAQVYPVTTQAQAENILNSVRKKYYDATHHCFAYKLFNGHVKYSDDGEPAGTAGIRILNAIEHFDLQNVLIIVIRYFGGTKLGVGPLGKAYYTSALNALEISETVEKKIYFKIKIFYDYDFTNKVHHILSKHSAKGIVNGFDNKPFIECMIEGNKTEDLIGELIESTSNKIKIEKSEIPQLI